MRSIIGVILFCIVCGVFAAPQAKKDKPVVVTLRSEFEPSPDGGFTLYEEKSDGSRHEQVGTPKQIGDEIRIVYRGSYSFVDEKDGQTYTVDYIADENGYQPSGAHLPKQPAIVRKV